MAREIERAAPTLHLIEAVPNRFATHGQSPYHPPVGGLVERIDRSIQQHRLLKRGQELVVAVSGGLDSMCLLDVLHQLSARYSWRLTVAHLNHGLRGRSSAADERLVARTARKLGLPIVVECARKIARGEKGSVEMAARKVRHDFLARTAARLKIRTVALAHHADDQIELFFLRLLRGGGNEGLAGMKWKRLSPADSRIELIRPLLDQPKTILHEHAREEGIQFREDASNASFDHQRNRIRHELLPLLRRHYQPGLDRTVLRFMEIAGAEAEVAGRLAAEWLKAKAPGPFQSLPVAVQRRCIQLQLVQRRIPVDYELVELLRTNPGHSLKVSPESAVISQAGRLDVLKPKVAARPDLSRSEVNLRSEAGACAYGGLAISWRFASARRRGLPARRAGREVFDADKVGPRITLRHWCPGDRFRPSGMKADVKLQDLFTNNRIERQRRVELVVATTQNGELFWVEGLRISERFKLSEHTIRRLHWHWKRL